jgi:hypothetical protein
MEEQDTGISDAATHFVRMDECLDDILQPATIRSHCADVQ